jgi:E3 ubiquitin-protein ligase HERC1
MVYYELAGILFGVAVRTKKPLAVPLAPFVWKLLVGEPVSIDDLEETDSLYAQSLRGIRDIHQSGVTEATFHEVIKTVHTHTHTHIYIFTYLYYLNCNCSSAITG